MKIRQHGDHRRQPLDASPGMCTHRFLGLLADSNGEDELMITARNGSFRYKTVFSNDHHRGVSDTTEKNGGANAGFRPHDLLEAALASCLNIWVRLYADNHRIPLSGVETCVEIDRSRPEMVVFRYTIDLMGDLTDEQRKKLLQVATTCPVRKTLSKEIAFASVTDADAGD